MTEPQAPTTGRSVVTGSLWSVVARTLPLGYTLVVSVVAARVLGPTLMGRLALITFASASVTLLLSAGLATGLTRSIGEALGRGDGGAVRALVPWAVRVVAALGGASVAGFAVAAALAERNRGAWLLAGLATAGTLLHVVPSVVLAGAQRWREANIVGLSSGVVHVAVAVTVLAAGGGITALLALDAAVSGVNVLGTGLLARRQLARLAPASTARDELRRTVARYALGTAPVVLLSYVIERRSELFLLALFAASAEIALYSIPFSALAVLALVPTAIGMVTSTAFATLYGAGTVDRIRAGHERALRLTLLVALPATAAALALGPGLLRYVYGAEYRGTGTVLVLLVAALPLIVVTALEVALLQGLGRVREQLAVYGAAAVANIAVGVALIPPFDAIGAAIAHSVAYMVAAAVAVRATRRLLGGIRPRLELLGRAALVSLVAGAAAYAASAAVGGATGVAVGFAAGAAVLGLLARALRVIPRDDATWMAGHFGRPVPRVVLAFAPRRLAAGGGRR